LAWLFGVLLRHLLRHVAANTGHVEEPHTRFLSPNAQEYALDFTVVQQVVERASLDPVFELNVSLAPEFRLVVPEVARFDWLCRSD